MDPNHVNREDLRRRTEKVRDSWDKQATRFDKSMGFFERRVFGPEHRSWASARARGATLEVAVGTALNLAHYPGDIVLTGIDLSPEMLAIARERASSMNRDIDLRQGDAHALPFEDEAFDSVVCTYSLCNIPDPLLAVAEMKRVLRIGGRLILVDHIRSSVRPILWLQRMIEFVSSRTDEYMTRRPLEYVKAHGLEVVERDRLRAGVVERLVAVKRGDG